jgi:hypothetical protein
VKEGSDRLMEEEERSEELSAALRALRGIDPALRQWIEDGYPTLTPAEHFERFGEPYGGARSLSDRAWSKYQKQIEIELEDA